MSQNYIPQIVIQTKPYITVSAKGISNGLSNTFNDGADFGPDTLLNATSPSQYGPPFTQTVGLQEAINYVSMLGGGVVFVLRGRYIQSTSNTMVYVPSNVIVKGEGIDITVIGMSINLGSQIQGSQAPLTTNAWLMDLTLDGTSFPGNQNGVVYNYVKDSGLMRVKVFNVPYWSIVGVFVNNPPMSPSLYLIDCIWDRNLNTAGGGQDMSAFNYNDKIYIINNVWKNNSEGSTILTFSNVNMVFIRGLEMRNVGSAYRGLNLGAAVYSVVEDVFSDSGSHTVGSGTVGQSTVIMNISGYSSSWGINTQFAHISGVKRLNYNGQTGFYFTLTPVAGSSSSTVRNNYSVTDVDVDQVGLNPQPYSTWYLFMRSVRDHPDPIGSPPPGAGWGQFTVYNPNTLTNSQIYFNAEVSAGTLNLNYYGPSTSFTGLTLSGYLKAKLRVGSIGVPVNGSIYLNNALNNLRIEVEGLDVQPSIQQNLATFTASYIKIKYGGTSSIYPLPATPAVPASGTANTVTNNNPYPVVVMINGSVTGVYITPSGGTQTQVFGSVSNATVRLNPGDAIALTYSTAPTWTWLPA